MTRYKTLVVLACLLASGAFAVYQAQSIPTMTSTANAFLNSLSPEQRDKATFGFSDDERMNWHFTPVERSGLPIKEMEPYQRQLAHALVISGLSQEGYIKATTIMSLEQVLFEAEGTGRRISRDEELYFVSIFGTPSESGQWGWRFEGHHLALNFTIDGGRVVSTPSFHGANPAEVREGRMAGLRALGDEEDLARALLDSLDAEQKAAAVTETEAPRDIITGVERKAEPGEPTGLRADRMRADQKMMLLAIVREYVFNKAPDDANTALDEIRRAGTDAIYFSWAGGTARGEGHYYRLQGPTFLIEYDNTQNNANHIHSVWRDLEKDFGADLLAAHYRASHMNAEE